MQNHSFSKSPRMSIDFLCYFSCIFTLPNVQEIRGRARKLQKSIFCFYRCFGNRNRFVDFFKRISCAFPASQLLWTSESARVIQSWVMIQKFLLTSARSVILHENRLWCQFLLRIWLRDFSQCASPNGFACEILRIISRFAVEHFNENAVRRESERNATETHAWKWAVKKKNKNGRL